MISGKVLHAWFLTTDYLAGIKKLILEMTDEEYNEFVQMSEKVIDEMKILRAK